MSQRDATDGPGRKNASADSRIPKRHVQCLWEELSKSNWSKFNSAGVRIFPNQRRKAASLGRFIEAGDTSADAKQAAAGRLMRRLENLTFIDISRESKRCGGVP